MQKVLELRRAYLNEETGTDDLVIKKIYVNEKNGEKILRFPVDIINEGDENKTHGAIYDIPVSHIHKAFDLSIEKLLELVDDGGIGSYEVEAFFEDVSVSLNTFLGQCYFLQVTCDLLGESGEEIIELSLEKDDFYFSSEDFGLEIIKEVAPSKLETWVHLIKENKI